MICPTYSHRSFLPRNHKLYNADGHMLCSEKNNCTLEMIGKFKFDNWDLPGGPVAKTPCSQYKGPRFNLWSGN